MAIISKRYLRAWSEWNLRIAVLSSLCLQILLIFLSPLRKRTRRIWLNAIIWLCYLMADWIAAYSIGVIVNISAGDASCDDSKCVDPNLAAFWAPFLLLHLGGPDTITAFSLQDNELWMRHLFSLIVEVVVVIYVLFLAIPSYALWLPFLLVFVAGSIKYAERTRALYRACLGNIKESRSRYNVSKVEDRMKETVMVQDGYTLYMIFRKLIPGLIINLNDLKTSVFFIRELEPIYAFNLMAVELNFIYDELFTQMTRLHRGFSYFLRFTCNVLIAVAFVIFFTASRKKLKISHIIDIALTYALLIGAIFLDFIALINLVFSDWMIAFLNGHPKASEVIYSIYKRMNCYNNFRWSESISQHNFISYCMIINRRSRFKKCFDAIIDSFGLTAIFKELRYKDDRNVSEGLKEFIYNWLKKLLEDADGKEQYVRRVMASRGKRTLYRYHVNNDIVNYCVEKIEYEESLFIWHIATDLLYFTLDSQEEAEAGNINHREICKILSDYMFYLYIMRPSLISTHQGGYFLERLDQTCFDATRVLKSEELSGQRDVCEKLLSRDYEKLPPDESEYGYMFVLRQACILADELKTITEDRNKMWDIMSKVLLEMLCYGAYRSRGEAHAQQLSKGGEFITFVWLLMAHFGATDCFFPLRLEDRQRIVS